MAKRSKRTSSKRKGKKQRQSLPIGKAIVWPFKAIGKAIAHAHRAGTRKTRELIVEQKRPRSKPVREPFLVIEEESGSIERFDKMLVRSSIGIVLGARGSGKTALGLRLLENVADDRPSAAMGFKRESLPRWVTPVDSVDRIPNGSCVLVDEGGVLFSSRSSMSEANRILSELMLISRHKDLSIVFISQNSSNLEVNVLRQADYLVLKPASLLQLDFERKVIEKIYRSAKKGFERNRDVPGLVYVYSDAFKGFASNALPSFWESSLSTQFKDRQKDS